MTSNSPFASPIHSKKCITVHMSCTRTQKVGKDFKQMMTYGLDECTAMVMIETDDNFTNPEQVIFSHIAPVQDFYAVFKQFYSPDKFYQVFLKTPGVWCQDSGGVYNIFQAHDKKFEKMLTKDNIKLTTEPYSMEMRIEMCIGETVDYNSTMTDTK